MKVSRKEYEKFVLGFGYSYQRAADALGVSKSAVARAKKKYEAEDFEDGKSIYAGEVAEVDFEKAYTDTLSELETERQKVNDLHRSVGRHTVVQKTESHFKIALISDTHYGSLYHDAGALHSFLEYAKSQNVIEVLHAGDVLEGEKMHFGQDRELSHAGFTAQLSHIKDIYPSDLGIPVKFIIGNHDNSYRKQSGIDVGAAIEAEMGWTHVGDSFGEVEYSTPNGSYRVCLLHPGGGTAYALSYRLQKIIEQWEGGKKPDCLVAGHFHKALWIPSYRNVSAFHPGCFQKQTPFMASKGLAAHVAGVILEVTVGGDWNIVKSEFVTYY